VMLDGVLMIQHLQREVTKNGHYTSCVQLF